MFHMKSNITSTTQQDLGGVAYTHPFRYRNLVEISMNKNAKNYVRHVRANIFHLDRNVEQS